MCYYYRQTRSIKEIEARFEAVSNLESEAFEPGLVFNGFAHPFLPVITNREPGIIQLFSWGLLPSWSKDRSFQKSTLNARVETIQEKPAFRSSVNKRCLIPADGFYEWQWLDEKGKKKQRFFISVPGQALFAFAGLWSLWKDPVTGKNIGTFAILTTEATGIMAEIHNSKNRMPVILPPQEERSWLETGDLPEAWPDLVADLA